MSEPRPRFPEYGEGGDYVGARRARRAFRFFVASLVLFTLILVYAEGYLQYDTAERLYVSALTLPPESARVFLLQAVRSDERLHDAPTPKYLQALAPRDYSDAAILETYEKAFNLEKSNEAVALRYGCRLLAAGRSDEAAAKFDAAAAANPDNALPLYLKAAAQLWDQSGQERLSESLALVAQANNSGKRIVYPLPLWSSELPQRGLTYAALCREIVDECTAPLYRYSSVIVRRAREDLDKDRVLYWDSWLQTLQQMGERLAESAVSSAPGGGDSVSGSALQAIAGIRIQLAALELRQRIPAVSKSAEKQELAARRAKLETALEDLNRFENARDAAIARDRMGYALPGRLLPLAFLAVLLFYLVAYPIWRRWGSGLSVQESAAIDSEAAPTKVASKDYLPELSDEPERTIRHTWAAKTILAGGGFALLMTLFLLTAFQRSRLEEPDWIPYLTLLWWAEIAALLIYGIVYPALALPRADRALRTKVRREDIEEWLEVAKRLRRRATFCLRYRYFGIMLGVLLTTISVWVIGYRIAINLYPWQVELLTTGLIAEETAAVKAALSMLT